ncbi:hypothetical protein Q5O24_07465 [Eubacteriaceae bacterium ES3]|nr:hypothetical protein Q5O24_09465 [Eubacteriaceae bacterium ES3]WKY46730.1 hypothetical protein Q5O24_10125 [Eubacteriaceae bacterium ES3]WKY47216.1 hypothetical protein Q5O24_12735 [Eubacteriaceae bacterium ES3]WKY47689.1 hypothetical protein Q5O24_15270 [Eubacteriaceae bacterium ES3]WKY49019.1 hypothetical protein Q5O24_06810 [Eubacteriaceae bacterium ES3]
MEKSENRILWEERIKAQLASGLTQRQWCEKNNLALSAFRYWKLRISKANRDLNDLEPQEFAEETVNFAGIVIAPEISFKKPLSGTPKVIEIRISDVVVMIPPEFSENHLTNIISAIRKA